jgi:hypothetical protein
MVTETPTTITIGGSIPNVRLREALIGVLPEGQLNPMPEQGLLHVLFSGDLTLAKMSRQPNS